MNAAVDIDPSVVQTKARISIWRIDCVSAPDGDISRGDRHSALRVFKQLLGEQNLRVGKIGMTERFISTDDDDDDTMRLIDSRTYSGFTL